MRGWTVGKASGPPAPARRPHPRPTAPAVSAPQSNAVSSILAAVAAVIAGAVYLVVGSISGGSTVLGVFRVLGLTAGLTLVIGAVMTAIGARMRGRRGAD